MICKVEKKDGQNLHLGDKAFSPDEVVNPKLNLEIDNDYYITQQLLPPITRLIEHIDGIEVDFVAQCLGVDPKKFKFHSSKEGLAGGNGEQQDDVNIRRAVMSADTEQKLKQRSIAELNLSCYACNKDFQFPGVY